MSTKKIALITGITGQDGSYLAEFLLKKGYQVHGIKRRSSSFNTKRIDNLYEDPHDKNRKFFLHYGDLTDSTNLIRIIKKINPDEIYNLAAQSHVAVSFESPEYTANCDALGPLRLLDAIRLLNMTKKCKIYQASTSEIFGNSKEVPQNEKTPFHPRSPYGVAKLYAYWITVNYREAYGIFACNGIMFNHESPRRGETFVTRKITRGLARIDIGLDDCLYLGNLDAKRDWGHAKDYVEMQWLMLQQDEPDDYVISSGRTETVRKFVELCGNKLGWERNKNHQSIIWKGEGIYEEGIRYETGEIVVKIDQRYFRPTEIDQLLGDASKARDKLGWVPKSNLDQLISEMINHDKKESEKELILRNKGFKQNDPLETIPEIMGNN